MKLGIILCILIYIQVKLVPSIVLLTYRYLLVAWTLLGI
jgi:hypothetical protein